MRALFPVPYDDLEDVYKKLYGLSPAAGAASGYCDLFIFHPQSGEAAFRHILQHAFLRSGTHLDYIPIPDAVPDAFFLVYRICDRYTGGDRKVSCRTGGSLG